MILHSRTACKVKANVSVSHEHLSTHFTNKARLTTIIEHLRHPRHARASAEEQARIRSKGFDGPARALVHVRLAPPARVPRRAVARVRQHARLAARRAVRARLRRALVDVRAVAPIVPHRVPRVTLAVVPAWAVVDALAVRSVAVVLVQSTRLAFRVAPHATPAVHARARCFDAIQLIVPALL